MEVLTYVISDRVSVCLVQTGDRKIFVDHELPCCELCPSVPVL